MTTELMNEIKNLKIELKDCEKELEQEAEENEDLKEQIAKLQDENDDLRGLENTVEELEEDVERLELIYIEDQDHLSKMKHCDNCRYKCKNQIEAIHCAMWQLGA